MAGRGINVPEITTLKVKSSNTERKYAYIDNERDIRVEARRIDGDEWLFSIHGGSGEASITLSSLAADLLSEFIESIRGIPKGSGG